MHNRALVGRDSVRAVFQGRADVVDGGLARLWIERSEFKEHVGPRSGKPFTYIAQRLRRCWQIARQQRRNVEAPRVGEPAQAPRRHAGQSPLYAVAPTQFWRLRQQMTGQRAPDVTKTQYTEVVCCHCSSPDSDVIRFCVLRSSFYDMNIMKYSDLDRLMSS